jgi:hypothetical protein
MATTPAPDPSASIVGGPTGRGGPPDFYQGDPGLAAALSLASPEADQAQGYQNGQSPGMQRMSTPTPPSSSSSLPGGADVWVTVPVDKVSVANGKGTAQPLFAAGSGYQDQPIPPTTTTGSRG